MENMDHTYTVNISNNRNKITMTSEGNDARSVGMFIAAAIEALADEQGDLTCAARIDREHVGLPDSVLSGPAESRDPERV